MATSYGGFLQNDRSAPPPPLLPPWLSIASTAAAPQPPSVSLTLSQPEPAITVRENPSVSEIAECCRELEESRRAWAAHRSEAAWRLSRVELQLESEKACRRREKAEETERKIEALRGEQRAAIDRIEAEYREQLAGLRKEAEAKERKLGEQWAAKHSRMTKFLEQMGCPHRSIADRHNIV